MRLPCVFTIISLKTRNSPSLISTWFYALVLESLGLDAYSRSQLELSETYSGTLEKIFILKFPPILTIQCVYY